MRSFNVILFAINIFLPFLIIGFFCSNITFLFYKSGDELEILIAPAGNKLKILKILDAFSYKIFIHIRYNALNLLTSMVEILQIHRGENHTLKHDFHFNQAWCP